MRQSHLKLDSFNHKKLKRILHTDYLARVVALQNGYMIPLSKIQVCHSSRIVTPVRTLLATQSRPERVVTSGVDCIKKLTMLTIVNLWLTSKVKHHLPCLCCIKQFSIKMWLVAIVINHN